MRCALLAALAPAAAHPHHFGSKGGTDITAADIRAFDQYQLESAREAVRECAMEAPRCVTAGGIYKQVRCLKAVHQRGGLRTERCRRAAVQAVNVAKAAHFAEQRVTDPTPPAPVDHGYIGGDDVPCVGDGCKGCNSTDDVKPYVWSYHIHFNWEENATYQDARKSSDAFAQKIIDTFGKFNMDTMKKEIKDCAEYSFIDDLWNKFSVPAENHELHPFAEICYMPGPSGGNTYSPGGPFLMWNRGFIISPVGYHQILPWLMANRPHDDLVKFFVHPNTGCQYNDLRHWSMWVGPSAVLDMRVMKGCVWAGCEDGGCIGKDAGAHPDYEPAGYGPCYDYPETKEGTLVAKCELKMGDSNTTTEVCDHPALPTPAPAPKTPAPPPPPPPPPAPPLPPAVKNGGPQPGELYCGTVANGVILNMNLTVNADGSFNFQNHIVIAQLVVACPHEHFDWKPGVGCDPSVTGKSGCGTIDITTATSDPDDCLVAGGKMEGGATHDFIYNGDEARSIDSKDSKFGTVTLELTSLTHCDPHGNMPPPGPPVGPTPPSPAGKKYQCENACEPQTCYTCTAAQTGSSLADCQKTCK